MVLNHIMAVVALKYDANKIKTMVSLYSEIFIGTSLLILLVSGSILVYTPKYNHPVYCFQGFTLCILVWYLLLCRHDLPYAIDHNFINDALANGTKILMGLGCLGCILLGKTSKIKAYEYYVLVLLGFLGLSLITSSNDLVSIYLCLELQTLSFYILTTFQTSSSFSTEAGLKYFLLGAISSALLLFGISFIYGFTGTTNIYDLKILDTQNLESIYQSLTLGINCGLVLFCLGLLFKVGCVPFHYWLPDVYEGAPSYVTAIFAVVPKLAIFVVITRVYDSTEVYTLTYVFFVLALVTLVVGSVLALYQKKLKRLLAFSGISHVGYILYASSVNTIDGYSSIIFYVVVYIVTSLFLWGIVCNLHNFNGRTSYLSDMVYIKQSCPLLTFTLCNVVFSLAGIPPYAGFFAKFAIFASLCDVSLYYGILIGLLSSAIGVLYYLRLVKLLHFEVVSDYRPLVFSKGQSLVLGLSAIFLIFFVLVANLTYSISYLIGLSF